MDSCLYSFINCLEIMNDHLIHRIDQNNVSAEQWVEIYKQGGWGGEGSGLGSSLKNNLNLIQWISNFIDFNNVKSIIDLGCGDLQWIPTLLKMHKNLSYTGVDCVKDLLNNHKINHSDHNFILQDIFSPLEGNFDLLLCKDVLQHNIKNADSLLSAIDKINAKFKLIISPMNILIPLKYSYIYVNNCWIDECKFIYLKS